jgi:ketosteroid isomerase-like protein
MRISAWSKAFETRDLEAIVSYYAEGVTVLPPNMPAVAGKQAAREVIRSQLAMSGRRLTFFTTTQHSFCV